MHATVLAKAGRVDQARRLLSRLATEAPAFIDTAQRLAAAGLVEPGLFKKILPET